MQRTKTIEVAGQLLTISEIPVTRVYSLLLGDESIAHLPAVVAAEKVKALIPLAIEDGALNRLLAADLYQDDLQLIYETFKETNPHFFEMASHPWVAEELACLIRGWLNNYFSRLLILWSMANPTPGDGVTDSSLT